MSSPLELNISLEDHLLDALSPLPLLLPNELSTKLTPYLSSPSPRTIPYSLLFSISQYARSPAFLNALQLHPTQPLLNPQSYTMVALLAGTTTSPERTFPKYVAKEVKAHEDRKRAMSDKKAITTLLNALLSIVGSGAATWLAAQRTGWREEWRVLLSFCVAVVVAISEAILYIIWQSRHTSARNTGRIRSGRHKRDDVDKHILDASVEGNNREHAHVQVIEDSGLRQRAIVRDTK